MARVIRKQTVENLELTVDENTARLGWWPRYQDYNLVTNPDGSRYVRANEAAGLAEYVKPLSGRWADLFLRFARWPEDPGMEGSLDTERNAASAKLWAEMYGVLGLDGADVEWGGENTLRRITVERLDARGHVSIPPWTYIKSGLGGPEESVPNFALETWEAHTVLRLYEALNTRTKASLETIRGFMSTHDEYDMPGRSYVEREIYGEDLNKTRKWAREIVVESVQSKVRAECYPTLEVYGNDASQTKQGWGYKSLLGAMWLQMMWLVAAPPRLCRYCGRAIGDKRKDKRYCDDRCRSNWHYGHGDGRSGKKAKKRSRLAKGSS